MTRIALYGGEEEEEGKGKGRKEFPRIFFIVCAETLNYLAGQKVGVIGSEVLLRHILVPLIIFINSFAVYTS